MANGEVALTVGLHTTDTITVTAFDIRAYTDNAGEQILRVPNDRLEADNRSGALMYWLPGTPVFKTNELTLTARYRYTSVPQLDDDSFRVRLISGGQECAFSDSFATPPADNTPLPIGAQPLTVTLVMTPTLSGDLDTDGAKIGVRMTPGRNATANGGDIQRTEFVIRDAQGKAVWAWSEYMPQYCAFRGDRDCASPPEAWWKQLTDGGHYTIKVTAYTRFGAAASDERTFIKRP